MHAYAHYTNTLPSACTLLCSPHTMAPDKPLTGNVFTPHPLTPPHTLLCHSSPSPHTMAPDKPITGNVVVDRMTAPIDKARDALSGRDV